MVSRARLPPAASTVDRTVLRATILSTLLALGCAPSQEGTGGAYGDLREAVSAFARGARPGLAEALESDLEALGAPDGAARLAARLDAHRLFELAEPAYDAAVLEAPSDPVLALRRARCRYELGRPEEALTELERAISLAPGRASLHWRQGLWLADQGRFEQARTSFERALALDPDDPSATVGLARLWIDDGRAEAALGLLEPLIERYPIPHALLLADRARRATGRPTASGDALVAGRFHWPDPWIDELDEWVVGRGERMDAVLDAIRGGRTDDALTEIEVLLAEDPDDVTVQGLFAAACARAGRPADALPLLREAAARQPRHYRIALNLSINLAAAGDLSAALVEARRAVALHPGHAGARYQLGRMAERAGVPEEARAAYLEALRLGYAPERIEPRLGALPEGERER